MVKIDGKAIAQKIIEELRKRPAPKKILAAVFVGMSAASESFLKIKEKTAADLGVNFQLFQLAEVVGQDEVEDKVKSLSRRADVGGIIVQLPLPKRFDREKVLALIDPKKDLDALGSSPLVESPTVGVVKEILAVLNLRTCDVLNIAVVGRGRLVGQPIIKWLEQERQKFKDLKIKIADEETKDLEKFLADADLVISGVGKKEGGLVKPEWLKEGAGVIDFGFPPDLDTTNEEHLQKLTFYTPTPGGTGPILVAKLFENFYRLNC